ncbi:MFS transporter [Paenibacillus nanensis]|uniref:MFS transporter n=1 Tax=Paenibacillus nanensis TaxID=393251 RepID=A0A3A1UUB2_9BACL|nr:MFS transporter [Paenibacillus nanensis]RIX52128.1 MFS transporter [Paenibacillus nanensis]
MLRKNRSFAKIFAAYGLSAFGDYFDFMAVSILLGFVWKADAMTIALYPLCFALPGILFGQLAGVAADRWNKRNVMVITDLVRAALTVLLIFAPNAAALLAIIALRSTARVFHYPAQQAMTRSVVQADQLLQATSLNGAVFQLSKVLGPLLGASVAAAVSPAVCMAVNVMTYTLSALLLLRVPASQGRVAAGEAMSADRPGMRAAWRDGWHILTRSRALQVSLAFSLTGMAGIQMIDAQFAVLFREIAPTRPDLMGWVVSAIGVGGLLSVAWLRRFRQLSAYGWLLGGGVGLIGLMFAAAGLFQPETPIGLMLLVFFLGGIGTGFTSTGMNYILQKETPPDAIGRISGIFDSLTSVIFIAAPLCGGLLIGWRGASATFLLVGLATLGIGLAGILLQRLLWGTKKPREHTASPGA